MFKVIIAGSRGFSDYGRLEERADFYLQGKLPDVEIVSGGARGADKLGEKYANKKGLSVALFPADWDTHGKSAGYIRNKEMAEYADALIAFWDQESRGTKHMIDLAEEAGLEVAIITG